MRLRDFLFFSDRGQRDRNAGARTEVPFRSIRVDMTRKHHEEIFLILEMLPLAVLFCADEYGRGTTSRA